MSKVIPKLCVSAGSKGLKMAETERRGIVKGSFRKGTDFWDRAEIMLLVMQPHPQSEHQNC